jgi:hypothetical protein
MLAKHVSVMVHLVVTRAVASEKAASMRAALESKEKVDV